MDDEQDERPQEMGEQEFIEKCLSSMMGGWVPLGLYLKLYPDESLFSIQNRVKMGIWKRQVHYASPKGSRPWVNLPAVKAWIEGPGAPRKS